MKKYYIHTLGCKVNQYESQLISEKFKSDNFEQVQKPQKADIIIVNSCTVTAKADKKCKYFLKKITKLQNNPKVLLTGCIVKNKSVNMKDTLQNIKIITDKTKLFKKQTVLGLDGHSRAFLKIQDGCNNFCSYCIVPYVRNFLWSKSEEEVLIETKNLAQNGYSEIVLTGINIGEYSYGISNLIKKIIKIPLKFRIRISSIELNKIDDKLIELMQKNPEKICHHLHIPLQSGSNEILRRMNRQYLTEDFETKINKIIQFLPKLTLTTDIITGFPGETKKNHKETCDFIKKIPFVKFHIFKYSNRYITKSSTFKNKISYDEIKSRSKELFEINYKKKTDFLNKNIGLIKKAVKIGNDKALTDNYITTKLLAKCKTNKDTSNIMLPKKNNRYQDSIFDIKITKSSTI
ncbi:MAG: MiaB/RimO family radical SAM methylthiotransferase [Endomicrobium sp.]|jgi:threonylcarbamoyladenosine tRNA methylthiotransferase MtaB|nr:MiaB/RimO family radical SAM methylthiotransferase [Endomicrobium sp.]